MYRSHQLQIFLCTNREIETILYFPVQNAKPLCTSPLRVLIFAQEMSGILMVISSEYWMLKVLVFGIRWSNNCRVGIQKLESKSRLFVGRLSNCWDFGCYFGQMGGCFVQKPFKNRTFFSLVFESHSTTHLSSTIQNKDKFDFQIPTVDCTCKTSPIPALSSVEMAKLGCPNLNDEKTP